MQQTIAGGLSPAGHGKLASSPSSSFPLWTAVSFSLPLPAHLSLLSSLYALAFSGFAWLPQMVDLA